MAYCAAISCTEVKHHSLTVMHAAVRFAIPYRFEMPSVTRIPLQVLVGGLLSAGLPSFMPSTRRTATLLKSVLHSPELMAGTPRRPRRAQWSTSRQCVHVSLRMSLEVELATTPIRGISTAKSAAVCHGLVEYPRHLWDWHICVHKRNMIAGRTEVAKSSGPNQPFMQYSIWPSSTSTNGRSKTCGMVTGHNFSYASARASA